MDGDEEIERVRGSDGGRPPVFANVWIAAFCGPGALAWFLIDAARIPDGFRISPVRELGFLGLQLVGVLILFEHGRRRYDPRLQRCVVNAWVGLFIIAVFAAGSVTPDI